MEANIYAPPETVVSDPKIELNEQFYIVARGKFLLLATATFGLYFVYWFYRNWALQKQINDDDSWPVARSIFVIFFTHELFARITAELDMQEEEKKEDTYSWQSTLWATVFVLFTIVGNIADRVIEETHTYAVTMLPLVILGLRITAIYRAQLAINSFHGDIRGSHNSRISLANIAWCAALPALLISAVFAGLFA